MRKIGVVLASIIILLGVVAAINFSFFENKTSNMADTDKSVSEQEAADWKSQVENESPKVATFAGGCFWCIEAIYDEMDGVESAVSGYTGGKAETATYSQVARGSTDHREAVQVKFYPSIVSYEELLDAYWRSIDPTDAGGQFADRGYQYTTAIYVHNEDQREKAEKSRQNLSESDMFDEPIVTEINEFDEFYVAEDKHQNYSEKRTAHYKVYKKASGREGFLKKIWEKTPIS